MGTKLSETLETFINMLMALFSFFLILRVILKFFSTNPATPFVNWIFAVSDFLIIPFAGIVSNPTTQSGILDLVAVITLAAYLTVSYLLLSLISNMKDETTLIQGEYPSTAHYHEVSKKKDKPAAKLGKSLYSFCSFGSITNWQ